MSVLKSLARFSVAIHPVLDLSDRIGLWPYECRWSPMNYGSRPSTITTFTFKKGPPEKELPYAYRNFVACDDEKYRQSNRILGALPFESLSFTEAPFGFEKELSVYDNAPRWMMHPWFESVGLHRIFGGAEAKIVDVEELRGDDAPNLVLVADSS